MFSLHIAWAISTGLVPERMVRAGFQVYRFGPAGRISAVQVLYETEIAGFTTGAAISQANISSKAGAGKANTRLAEIYARYELNKQLQITPSVQWIENSNFDNTSTLYNRQITVFSLRANFTF